MKLYLDESGNASISGKSTSYFIIALVVIDDEKRIAKCFKRIRQRKMKKQLRQINELKFHNSRPEIRKAVLTALSGCDIEIAYAAQQKNLQNTLWQKPLPDIYSALTLSILEQIIEQRRPSTIELFFDKVFSFSERERFNSAIKTELNERLKSEDALSIHHIDSQTNPCIQAADFIAGAIFQYHERNNDEYFKIIEKKILVQTVKK